jgi:peptide/nickel transport system ATP-binding protein
MTALLDVRSLEVRFGNQAVVRDLDFTLEAGQTLALVGESGCGKSSTAMALMRLLPKQAKVTGQLLFEGRELLALPEKSMSQLRGDALSMIFQEPMTSLNPLQSIGQQVAETLILHRGIPQQAALAEALNLLDRVKLPEARKRLHDYPHQLSGGQRQRVMIAAAIACKPRLLIADEPTTALDVTLQAQILALLDELRAELGMGLLLITHDLGVVGQWADRVVVMHGGRKVEQASTERLFARHPQPPLHPYAAGLLQASMHDGGKGHYRDNRLSEIRVRQDAQGQPLFQGFTPAPVQLLPIGRQPLLQVRDLKVHYAAPHGERVEAVRGVSFEVRGGQTVGLVGESGCGKSSLSRAIMRLVDSAGGQILLGGEDLTALHGRALKPFRRRVQMVFQDPYASLNPRQNVATLLDTTLRIHAVGDRRERQQRAARMLDAVGLPSSALARYPHEFSGGQRQRIGIARALLLEPQLLICDEPVSALDVSVQAQILNLLVELKAQFNLAYLFISHDLAVVRYFADQVLVMNAGRIVESGTHQQVWQHPQHPYTQSLIEAVPSCRPEASWQPLSQPAALSAVQAL